MGMMEEEESEELEEIEDMEHQLELIMMKMDNEATYEELSIKKNDELKKLKNNLNNLFKQDIELIGNSSNDNINSNKDKKLIVNEDKEKKRIVINNEENVLEKQITTQLNAEIKMLEVIRIIKYYKKK